MRTPIGSCGLHIDDARQALVRQLETMFARRSTAEAVPRTTPSPPTPRRRHPGTAPSRHEPDRRGRTVHRGCRPRTGCPAEVRRLACRSILDGLGLAIAGSRSRASAIARDEIASYGDLAPRCVGAWDRRRGAGSFRGLPERPGDPRRRLRRHSAGHPSRPRLRPAHPPHRARAAGRVRARRARRSQRSRRSAGLPDRRRGGDQDRRGDRSAALQRRVPFHRDGRRHRRRAAAARILGLDTETTRGRAEYRRLAGRRPARELRHDDQAVPRRPRRGERRLAASLAEAGFTAAPNILEARRGFFNAAGGAYDQGPSIAGRLGNPWTFADPGHLDQAASVGLADAPRDGRVPRPGPGQRPPARAGHAHPHRDQPPYAQRAHPPPPDRRPRSQVQHGVLPGHPAPGAPRRPRPVHRRGGQPGGRPGDDRAHHVRGRPGRRRRRLPRDDLDHRSRARRRARLGDRARAEFGKGSPANPMRDDELVDKFLACLDWAGIPAIGRAARSRASRSRSRIPDVDPRRPAAVARRRQRVTSK